MDVNDQLTQRDADLILEALTAKERDGLSLRDAFDRVPMSVDTYYRRKDEFPNEVDRLQREAEKQARKERWERHQKF